MGWYKPWGYGYGYGCGTGYIGGNSFTLLVVLFVLLVIVGINYPIGGNYE